MQRDPSIASAQGTDNDSEARIELCVGALADLFDHFDPAPLRERSLSPEIAGRIVSRAEVLPSDWSIEVRLHVRERTDGDEQAVRDAFSRHFAREAVRHERLIARTRSRGWRMLFGALGVALVLVVVSQFIAEVSELRVVRTLANGMSIVIWVTLWRPVESLVYDWRPDKESLRLCDRLTNARVELCSGQAEGAP